MTTGDANEEMERPLSKKASTIWGFDEEDDAALETQQLAECSDIQMIRGFSDSESDEEEAPRGGRARNPTREDGDDEVGAPRHAVSTHWLSTHPSRRVVTPTVSIAASDMQC